MKNRTVWLIVIGAVVVLIGGLGTLVYLSRGLFDDTMRAFREGSASGRGQESQTCVEEAVRRYDPQRNMLEQTSDSMFVMGCLGSSGSSDELCATIPQTGLLNQAPLREWAQGQCRERSLEGLGCPLIFVQVANYCRTKR